ncbi:hypothetical protein MPSEU_000428700 [Mayamaea pseudoterrestris]|nr:hypothetical protein MPSEU_000428700 [Mayamaea pseudoterrestris]
MAPVKSTKPPPPDFKRVKAKVGKRAPKPANLTDTAFKSASVSVRRQTVAASTTPQTHDELLSSRGHSISELTLQLQHPAQAVRLSAAKGLKDLVHNSTDNALWNHLSSLVPVVAKCCVDQEEQVREVGLFTLKDLLSVFGSNATLALTPFAPLLMATLSCALNSLDEEVRTHGAIALEMLCQKVPRVVAPQLSELLPALVRLLSQTNLFKQPIENGSGDAPTKKRKVSKPKRPNSDFSLASGLLSLLTTNAVGDESLEIEKKSSQSADLVITETAGSRNAVTFIHQRHSNYLPVPLNSLQDVALFAQSKHSLTSNQATSITCLDLMNCFRNALIEVSQRRLPLGNDGETLLLLCKSIQCFWELYQHQLLYATDKERASIEKTCRQIGRLILEIFPSQQQGSSRSLTDELDSVLCAVLYALAMTAGLEKESEMWKKRVASHVLSSVLNMNQLDALDGQVHTLRLFGQFVLRKNHNPGEAKLRVKLVRAFGQTFFQESTLSAAAACSAVGHEAARLACALFELEGYDIAVLYAEFGPCSIDFIRQAPNYLSAWSHEFPSKSYCVLTFLHHVARQSVTQNDSLFDCLKAKLQTLFAGSPSIFELYPESSQRLLVSLVVILGKPLLSSLSSLGQICARSRRMRKHVSSAVVSFIMQSFHSIRKELPMHAYLTFILDTTGLASCTDKALNKGLNDVDNHSWQTMMSYDLGVAEASQCFIDCGASKVLTMLYPLLRAWLGQDKDVAKTNSCDLLRLRAALVMLCLLSLDIGEYSKSSVWTILPAESRALVCDAIAHFYCNVPALDLARNMNSEFDRWTKPARILLSTDAILMTDFFAALCAKVVHMDSTEQAATIACMSLLVNDGAELEPIVHRVSSNLLDSVEHLAVKGPIQDQVSRLMARLTLFSEHTTTIK